MSRGTIITVQDVRRLALLHCTEAETAGVLGITKKTFRKLLKKDERVAKAWREGQAYGKMSLRRKQMNLAGVNGSVAIWLGKQLLGQKEIQSLELSGRNGKPIEVNQEVDLSHLSRKKRIALLQQINELLEGSPSVGEGNKPSKP